MDKYPLQNMGSLDNVETEGSETMLQKSTGNSYEFKGPRHSAGGVDVMLSPDDYVFSDNRKLSIAKNTKIGDLKLSETFLKEIFGKSWDKKKTIADISKQFDTGYWDKLINDPFTKDPLTVRTAQIMKQKYMAILESLSVLQESHKASKGMDNDLERLTGSYQESVDSSRAKMDNLKYGGLPKKPYGGPGDPPNNWIQQQYGQYFHIKDLGDGRFAMNSKHNRESIEFLQNNFNSGQTQFALKGPNGQNFNVIDPLGDSPYWFGDNPLVNNSGIMRGEETIYPTDPNNEFIKYQKAYLGDRSEMYDRFGIDQQGREALGQVFGQAINETRRDVNSGFGQGVNISGTPGLPGQIDGIDADGQGGRMFMIDTNTTAAPSNIPQIPKAPLPEPERNPPALAMNVGEPNIPGQGEIEQSDGLTIYNYEDLPAPNQPQEEPFRKDRRNRIDSLNNLYNGYLAAQYGSVRTPDVYLPDVSQKAPYTQFIPQNNLRGERQFNMLSQQMNNGRLPESMKQAYLNQAYSRLQDSNSQIAQQNYQGYANNYNNNVRSMYQTANQNNLNQSRALGQYYQQTNQNKSVADAERNKLMTRIFDNSMRMAENKQELELASQFGEHFGIDPETAQVMFKQGALTPGNAAWFTQPQFNNLPARQ